MCGGADGKFLRDPPTLSSSNILPPFAAASLPGCTASLKIDYPMLFRVTNVELQRVSHCGVMEFVADEGVVYLPFWMMENLCLQEGQMVEFENVSLSKGTFVKLRPHTSDFLDISNPKAVLEHTLRNFTCLTVGDTIVVNYNNKRYCIDIVEAKPQEQVSIIETDCEVDFAPPKDYKEPERQPTGGAGTGISGAGTAVATAGSGGDGLSFGVARGAAAAAAEGGSEEEEPEPPRFQAFTGSGNRLDGKSVASRPAPPPKEKKDAPQGAGGPGNPPALGKRPSGKLMFGGGQGAPLDPLAPPKPPPLRPAPGAAAAAAPREEKPEEPKFKAFSGKSNSLK